MRSQSDHDRVYGSVLLTLRSPGTSGSWTHRSRPGDRHLSTERGREDKSFRVLGVKNNPGDDM